MDTGGSDIPIQERFMRLVVLLFGVSVSLWLSGLLTFAEPLE
jgi:hypothetical protein